MADVAACFEALCRLPVIRRRLEKAAGRPLSSTVLARLAVLAFLHDIGKLHPGFQAIGWPLWPQGVSRHGHQQEGLAIFCDPRLLSIRATLPWSEISNWTVRSGLLVSVFSHHGRPIELDGKAGAGWTAVSGGTVSYDPFLVAKKIGQILPDWFPNAFAPSFDPLPDHAGFQHFFCGLLTLADWIGSDRRIFSFVAHFDPNYMSGARQSAARATRDLRLDVADLQAVLEGRTDFAATTGFSEPNAHQKLVGACSLSEQLLILEAETGSGKTEAALWRFALLFASGLVDSLYFALPTRAAAVQLQRRVDEAAKRLFGEMAPETVLAVPGYLRAGTHEGFALPGFEVNWDDAEDERTCLARWAAESAKRYLAAPISVGTVDQAMLAALSVKHAHLRAACLSRSLLVIDECHASDSYMTEVQTNLLKMHLSWGGHAMLMSATLGSKARVKWLGAGVRKKARPKLPRFEEAVATPYPAVWLQSQPTPISCENLGRQKRVQIDVVPTMVAEEAARIAVKAAEDGARVLVVRNTVEAAIATVEAVIDAGKGDLLLKAVGRPALHHGRFAAEDRRLLDEAVEATLSPTRTTIEGRIVIGTQTLEQSLDVCADFLLTDLCPVDVLLQRIGRLHRHANLPRPEYFEIPRCQVMVPQAGLAPLLAPAFENGLGAWETSAGPQGIYIDLSVLELTRRLAIELPVWTIPADNRFLVESATHEEKIDALHAELGPEWVEYRNKFVGRQIAEVGGAKAVLLQLKVGFEDGQVGFPGDEERIRTRLGGEGARVTFTKPVAGPFGVNIDGVTLPAHWSHGLETSEKVTPEEEGDGILSLEISGRSFRYDWRGLNQAD